MGRNLGEEAVLVTREQGKQEEEEWGKSDYDGNLGEEAVLVTLEQVEAQQGKVDKAGGRASHRAGNSQSTMIR